MFKLSFDAHWFVIRLKYCVWANAQHSYFVFILFSALACLVFFIVFTTIMHQVTVIQDDLKYLIFTIFSWLSVSC